MIARFIGNSSMGFEYEKIYDIYSKIKTINNDGRFIPCICIYDKKSKAWCPYRSLETLLDNWEIEKGNKNEKTRSRK